MRNRILFVLKRKDSEKEIRYLLTDSIDGARVVALSEMANGIKTEIARGTEYEIEDAAKKYIAGEYNVVKDSDPPPFDTLPNTIALTMACGYNTVYDPTQKKFPNLLGEVALSSWTGLAGKNGGGYKYAFHGMKILAQPTLPPNHGLNMRPATMKERNDATMKYIAILKTVGPHVEFLLGRSDLDG